MKITNGNWLIQEHLDVMNVVAFFAAEPCDEGVRVYVAPRDVSTRGAQVDVPIFTYTFFSRAENTLGVRIEHYRGSYQTLPRYETASASGKVTLAETDEYVKITCGRMTATGTKHGMWHLDFAFDGRYLTGSGDKGAGYAVDKASHQPYVYQELHLGVGEYAYGLGERFSPFVKNGQVVDLWNRDGGTGSEQAYKNVPFYLTNRGYGVFIEQPERVELEVASEKVSAVQFSVPGECLTYHIVGGDTLKDVLTNYTAITGRPPELPSWSFGLWLSTSFATNYDEKTVMSFIDGMKERNIPLSVFHFDCFWMKGLHWTDFEWDSETFPDPEGLLKRLHEKGLKVCVWINPYISQMSRLFPEGKEKHYFLETADGSAVWQWDRWQPAMAIVDFTNPEAVLWYQSHLKRLLAMGVDCFKTDFGERIPTEHVRWHNGADPGAMHNYYAYLYNKVVFDVLKEEKGEGEAILFARSATAGSQKFPVHWGGDCKGNFDSMAETLRGGLSLGLSGFGYWSHDIGGFENTSPASVYKRWCAFGLLSSHSRLHGSQSYRVPWAYDQEAVDVLRHFVRTKCRLMPYLWNVAEQAHEKGIPMMRAMLLEFPEDPTTSFLDRQYMLGNALLVAPVLSEDNRCTYYLPEGMWTHFFTGERKEGGRWYTETFDFMSLPLYIRENTILALGASDDYLSYDYLDGVTLKIASMTVGGHAETAVLSEDRTSKLVVTADAGDKELTLSFDGLTEDAELELPPEYELERGDADPDGKRYHVPAGTKTLTFSRA